MKVGYVFVELITLRLNQKYTPCFNIKTEFLCHHPASYPRVPAGSFSADKAAGASSYTTTPLYIFMT
jgi:hypothetical protein